MITSFWVMSASTGRVMAVILIATEIFFSLIRRNELNVKKLGHTTAQHTRGQTIILG